MKKIISNIIDHWKTTLLGLILTYVDLYYLLEKDAELPYFIILLIVGIGLMLVPDTFIRGLKKLIRTNQDKKF